MVPLRNQAFFALGKLPDAIAPVVHLLNERPFRLTAVTGQGSHVMRTPLAPVHCARPASMGGHPWHSDALRFSQRS